MPPKQEKITFLSLENALQGQVYIAKNSQCFNDKCGQKILGYNFYVKADAYVETKKGKTKRVTLVDLELCPMCGQPLSQLIIRN